MNKILIEELKQARLKKNLRQKDVAEQLGLKDNTISNWEKGRTEPDIDTLVKLCEIYEINFSNLLEKAYGSPIKKDNTQDKNTLNYDDLPEEAQKDLASYMDYLMSKYNLQESPIEQENNEEMIELQLIAYGGENTIVNAPKSAVEKLIAETNAKKGIKRSIAEKNLIKKIKNDIDNKK